MRYFYGSMPKSNCSAMKITFLLLALTSFLFSCEYNEVAPDSNFIRARIDGVETTFKTRSEEHDVLNYIRPGAIAIHFNKDQQSREHWTIRILYGNLTQEIEKLPLPFTISGPNPDFSGTSPEGHMWITDPDGGPYGKIIAQGSTFHHEFTITIHSIEDDVIQGTFYGVGFGEFEDGEFSAKLVRRDW